MLCDNQTISVCRHTGSNTECLMVKNGMQPLRSLINSVLGYFGPKDRTDLAIWSLGKQLLLQCTRAFESDCENLGF